jgi:hypothetical protein
MEPMSEVLRDISRSSRFWNGLMVFLVFPKQNSTLSRRKLIKNRQTGMRNSFLAKVPHNSDLIFY